MSKDVINRAEIAQKEVLTRREAAVYLGISFGYLNQLCARRAIPYFQPLGKVSYFKRSELENWCFRNRVKTMEEIKSEAARV